MECEANYRDEEVCPPLIGIARLTRKIEKGQPIDETKLSRLRKEVADV